MKTGDEESLPSGLPEMAFATVCRVNPSGVCCDPLDGGEGDRLDCAWRVVR